MRVRLGTTAVAALMAAVASQLVGVPAIAGFPTLRPTVVAAGADLDGAVLTFQLVLPPMAPIAFPTSGTFGALGSCAQLSPAPSFVNVPPSEVGTCGQFTASGSITEESCLLGQAVGTGSANLVEPNGDQVSLGSMTLLLTGPTAQLQATYLEAGSPAGTVVGVGLAVPPLGLCPLPSTYSVTMVLASVPASLAGTLASRSSPTCSHRRSSSAFLALRRDQWGRASL